MGTAQTVVQLAWGRFVGQAMGALPHVLASLLVLALGLVVGAIVSRVTNRMLTSSQLDRVAARLGLSPSLEAIGISSSVRLAGRTLHWLIVLAASMVALYSLDARLASDLTERLFLYLPHVAVAIAILAVGMVSARFLARGTLIACVNHDVPSARLFSALTRVGVMVIAGSMALEHLGIGQVTILAAFAILFGGATLAAAIALGYGMQDAVRQWIASEFERREPAQAGAGEIRHW